MIAIATIVTMLFLGIMGTTFNYMTANRLAGSTEDLGSAQAFYVAEGGLQYVAMDELNGENDFSTLVSPTGDPFGGTPIDLGEGQFWVEYEDQAVETMTVKVTARVGEAVRIVEVSVGQDGTGFNYATMAEGNININSSGGDVFGDVGLGGNANIDEDTTIHGDINENEDFEVPVMDPSVYEDMCTVTFVGNKTFNADYTGNACVTGNVTINANVTYTGILYAGGNVSINGDNVIINGSIVAEGNIDATGRSGLQFNAQPGTEPGTYNPALVSEGLINLKNDDNMQVNGVMWSDGNMDFTNSDNVTFTGSFMTKGNLVFNTSGALTITFASQYLVGIPGMGELGEGEASSLSFSSWRTYPH